MTFDDTRFEPRTKRTELEEYVWQFAESSGLQDRYELLRFGARLARDKHEATSRYEGELTDPEKELLEKGLVLYIPAPTPNSPSMTMAVEQYIKHVNK